MPAYHMKDLPLLKFEVYFTRACELAFIEIIRTRMLKASRKVTCGVG